MKINILSEITKLFNMQSMLRTQRIYAALLILLSINQLGYEVAAEIQNAENHVRN